jgi:periplasmic divalent cation tolerance protein
MTDAIQISTTTGDRATAERIAAELVDRRLAACVQISGPITSTYRWQEKVETTEEWLCTIKTLAANFAAVQEVISKLHPYDVPEILAVPVVAGSEAYLEWLHREARIGACASGVDVPT